MFNRRDFLKFGGAGMAALYASTRTRFLTQAHALSNSANLTKFIQPLRGVGEIPVAASDGTRTWGTTTATHYTIDIGQFEDQLHPELMNPTRLWGFGQGGSFKHLGGIIAAKRDEPVQITFNNNLPPDHILPVDDTIMGVMGTRTTASMSICTEASCPGSAMAGRTRGGIPTITRVSALPANS